jgi:hypothetical protein
MKYVGILAGELMWGFWWKNVWILGERCGDSGGTECGFWMKDVGILAEECGILAKGCVDSEGVCADSGGRRECGFWGKSVGILKEEKADSDGRWRFC